MKLICEQTVTNNQRPWRHPTVVPCFFSQLHNVMSSECVCFVAFWEGFCQLQCTLNMSTESSLYPVLFKVESPESPESSLLPAWETGGQCLPHQHHRWQSDVLDNNLFSQIVAKEVPCWWRKLHTWNGLSVTVSRVTGTVLNFLIARKLCQDVQNCW